jgi:CubicO group peptidase (beta-lactamase class C family)
LPEHTATDRGDGHFRPLDDRIREVMDRLKVPGVAVGVLLDGREYVAGYGITNVRHPLSVDPDTLFQIGSISKTVAGTAAMRLVELGMLDLAAPVRTYLPDLRLADEDVAARVTLRHLFTHTGGWVGDYFEHTGAGADALAKIVAKLAEVPQLTPLGEVFTYNNAGFYIAGRVIEVVTGHSYERALRELVLRPLGMTMSFFRHFATEFITHRVAAGHELRDGHPAITRPWARSRSAAPSGGIVSTVRDLLRYAHFHLSDGIAPDGARLLTPESVRLMQSPLFSTDSMGSAVGITWMLGEVGGVRVVRHGGSTFGQRALLLLVPERQFALAILTNAEQGETLHQEASRWALEHYLGAADPELVPLARSESELAPYVGRYVAALSQLEVAANGSNLTLRAIPRSADGEASVATPSVRLGFIGPDRVVVLDPPRGSRRGEFLRRPDGSIAWLRFDSRLHARQGV